MTLYESVLIHSFEMKPLIEEYQQAYLTAHDAGTIRVYRYILHQFMQWVEKQSGRVGQFEPAQITTPLVERYLTDLFAQGYSPSHCKRVKSVISQFCQWAIEEKATLRRNPVRGVDASRAEPHQ